MKKKSLGINAILNAAKTALGVIFPLVTFKYASSILGVDNIGMHNWSASVVSYAALFAALGVKTYAIRECAMVREDRDSVNKIASEVFSINLCSTAIAYVALFAVCFLIPKFFPYRTLIWILSFDILFQTLGCGWVYSIYEDYFYITVRSLIVHIVSMVLLFVFVHSEQDLIKYTVISAVASCGANIVNMIGRRKYCTIRPTVHLNLKKHLAPIMAFFMNSVTTTIYVHSDVLILGLMTNNTFVGLYTVAVKVYTIIKNILAAVITVSIPRLSSYWAAGDRKKIDETCHSIFYTLLILAAPAMVGLFSLSRQIVLLISSEKYISAYASLAILSAALLVSVFCWFFSSCILIPSKHENDVLKGTVVAAITNITLNIILIPFYQERAASVTTFIAEAVALGFNYSRARRVFSLRVEKRVILSVALGSLAIFFVCQAVIFFVGTNFLLTIGIAIPLSVLLYGIILFLFKNKYALGLFAIIKRKLSRKKRL